MRCDFEFRDARREKPEENPVVGLFWANGWTADLFWFDGYDVDAQCFAWRDVHGKRSIIPYWIPLLNTPRNLTTVAPDVTEGGLDATAPVPEAVA